MNFSDHYNFYAANDDPAVPEEPDNGEMFRDMPAVPLPGPGEGGPSNGGSMMPDNDMPMIPLPGPEEGGSVMPDANMPSIPLPNPGEGGPVRPGGGNRPIAPLPSPGEGGPVAPGFPSSIITVLPRPIVPCFFCNSNTFGNVRFLNAATGYNPFRISINNQTVVNNLDFAQISEYGRVSSGYQTVTVAGPNGYVYLSKQVQINTGTKYTIAIVNTAGGLDLVVITDSPCSTPANFSCLRACNLSYNSGPLSVLLNNGFSIFRNVQFREVTPYSRLLPGRYQFFVARNGRVLVSSDISVRSNSIYTIYMFNWNNSPDAIRTMIVEDRK